MQFFVFIGHIDDFDFFDNPGWNLSGYGGVQ
jgi:hypothetical protein